MLIRGSCIDVEDSSSPFFAVPCSKEQTGIRGITRGWWLCSGARGVAEQKKREEREELAEKGGNN